MLKTRGEKDAIEFIENSFLNTFVFEKVGCTIRGPIKGKKTKIEPISCENPLFERYQKHEKLIVTLTNECEIELKNTCEINSKECDISTVLFNFELLKISVANKMYHLKEQTKRSPATHYTIDYDEYPYKWYRETNKCFDVIY